MALRRAEAREQSLAPITVEGVNETAYGPVRGIVAGRSATATKTDTPLLETPQSISVVSSEQLTDQDADSLGEALRYSAGAQGFGFGFNPRETSFRIRGFAASPRTGDLFQDGLQLRNPAGAGGLFEVVPYGSERIELFRGPASVLYGQISPGGLVNFVTKRPPAATLGEVELEGGSHDEREIKLDFGGPVTDDDTLSYRITGLLRDSESQIDFIDDDRRYLAPALTWRPNQDTSLTLLAHYQEDETGDFQFLPGAGTLQPNPNGRLPPSRFTGEPGFDRIDRTEYAIGYLLEHQLGQHWSLRQNLRYTRNELDRGAVFSSGLQEDLRTLDRAAFTDDRELDGLVVDNQAIVDFTTAGIGHTLLMGIDYQHFDDQELSGFGEAPSIDIFDPAYGQAVATPPTFRENDNTLEQIGFYLQDQVELGEHWRVTVSGRYDLVESEIVDNLADSSQEQDDKEFTGRAGIVYVADNGLAPYFSYSESFVPSVGTNLLGEAFDPETAEQFEVGVKYQPRSWNAFITIAAFDLSRQNVLTPDPGNPMNQVQTGEIRSRGLEFEGRASLGLGLDLIANYTFLDAEITQSNVVNANGARTEEGETPVRVPEHQASLWAKYSLPLTNADRLSLGGGVRYIDDSFADTPNTITNPDFVAFDALIGYERGPVRFAVNATNLFDNEEVVCFSGGTFCNFRPVRQIVGSLRYRW